MTLLRPTPSRRRWLNRFPLWAVVVAAALSCLLLIGLALLLADRSDPDDRTTEVASPECTAGSSAPEPPSSGGKVNVLNATDREGLAAETAEEIGERGFTVGVIDNAPAGSFVSASAEVRHGAASADWARWVAAQVPGSELAPDSRTSDDVDLVLGDAFDELAGPKKAQRSYAELVADASC